MDWTILGEGKVKIKWSDWLELKVCAGRKKVLEGMMRTQQQETDV